MDKETDNQDMSPICRACLKSNGKTSIFAVHAHTSLAYSYIFTSCIAVQVNADDDLPKQICENCLKTLVSFYIFKKEVTKNDLKLRQILKIEIDKNTKREPEQNEKEHTGSTNCNFTSHKANTKIKESKGFTDPNIRGEFRTDIETHEILYKDKSEDYEETKFNDLKEQTLVSNKKSYQCDICGKILNSKSNLTQHYRKHTGERPYPCEICGKKFLRANHVIVHKRIHTGEKPHHCAVCLKSFNHTGGLSNHMRVHSGERPFICTICGKSFTQSSTLHNHGRIHSNNAPFTCKVCNKSFKNAGYLKVHTRFHEDKRPFSCEKCNKKFFTSSHLNDHIKGHNKEAPHKCIVCGKSFVRAQNLKIHIVTHTGEKAYSCKLCQKKFTQTSHLNKHMKIHKRL